MEKTCTECGKEIGSGVAFCAECGTKAPADTVTVHTPPARNDQVPQTCVQPVPDPTSKVVGTGAYFGLMLLFGIPIIGLIACVIMAFAPKNKNIKHFARAMLIWTIIGLVICGLLVWGLNALIDMLTDLMAQATGGQFTELGDLLGQLGELGDLTDQLGDMQDIMEQIPTGSLEGLPME